MKKLLIVLLLFSVVDNLPAQEDSIKQRLDSLKALLDESEESMKYNVLFALSEEYMHYSPKKTLKYSRMALQKAMEIDDDTLIADARKQTGNGFLLLSAYDSAQHYYQLSLDKSEALGYQRGMANALSNMALIYEYLGKYDLALEYNLKSLQIEEKLGNTPGVAASLNSVGRVYYNIKDYEKTEEYFLEALRSYQDAGDNEGVADMFNNLGVLYRDRDNYEKAILYFQSSLVICKEAGDLDGITSVYNNIGNVYFDKGEYETALSNYNKSMEYAHKINDTWSIANTTRNIGDVYLHQNKYKPAKKAFSKSLELAADLGAREIISQVYFSFSELYQQENNFRRALNYHRMHSNLEDSIRSQKTKLRIADLELGYQIQQQQSKLALKNKTTELEESQAARANLMIYLLLAALLILVLIIALVVNRSRIKKKTQQQLETKDREIARVSEELTNFNEKLETKVKQRTGELEEEIRERRKVDLALKKALKRAEDANYLKNAFLANMSHEIRTPLNGIIGFSSLLETELSLMENKELYEYASGIQQSGERLLHLLNNIIDISRIEANDMDISLNPCHVNEIVKNISELYSFKANDKGIKFNHKLNEIPRALADEVKLTKIISDVIDNAIKYTESGFINVVTDWDEQKGKIKVIVKDTGIGIDKAYLDHIFEAFRQESLGYSRTYQGAGLGLPLAKKILELINGGIEVESVKGSGTSVSIYLPAADPVPESSGSQGTEIGEKREPDPDQYIEEDVLIFIVEDDRMNRLVLEKMLNNTGKSVPAVDGDETMEVIRSYHEKNLVFDLMLFDINLPAPWDGIKLMNEIKKKYPEYRNIPFIAQTAYAMTGDKERLLEAGFDDYIAKPVRKTELISIIKRHINLSKKIN